MKFMGTVISIVMLLTVSIIILSPQEPDGVKPSRGPADPPIRIDSDSDLESQATANGWPGSGIEIDPFIIGNYTIDGSGHGCCIHVGNTTKHFVIRNCTVFNASYPYPFYADVNSKYYGENGINFWDVENGTLDNVSSSNNLGYGAWLHLDNGRVSGCDFKSNNRTGLWITGDTNLIDKNEFQNNSEHGLFCNSLKNGNLSRNRFLGNNDSAILKFGNCHNNTIFENYFRNNTFSDLEMVSPIRTYIRGNDMSLGLHFHGGNPDYYLTTYLDDTNYLDGGIIRYHREMMPAELDTDSPQIFLVNISDINIDGFESTHSISSMNIINCQNVTVSDSVFHDSPGDGLSAAYCRNLTLENCTSNSNRIGINAGGFFKNSIINCSSSYNLEDGISIGVSGLDDDILVKDCLLNENGGFGMAVYQSSGNASCSVFDNTITNNEYGLGYSSTKGGYFDGGYGLDIIRGNTVSGNEKDGMQILLSHSRYFTRVSKNAIFENGGGIKLADSSNGGTVIERNEIRDNDGDGFSCSLSNGFIDYMGRRISCGIFNNSITGNGGNGSIITTSSSGGVPHENNVISNNGWDGIFLKSISNGGPNDIKGNIIEGNGGVGIEMGSISNSGKQRISNNTIRFNGGWNSYFRDVEFHEELTGGILIVTDSSSGYPIINNIISDNNGTGIRIFVSSSGSGNISGNVISRNRGDGIEILMSSAGDRNIRNNTIIENRDSGIELGNGIFRGYTMSENIIYGNREGIYLHGANGTAIRRNIITENEVGILSRGGDNATVEMNLFSDNTDYGIKIETGNMSRIWNNSFFRNNGASSAYDEGHRQACDNGTGNQWYDNETGNYWDDWRNASAIPIRTDPYPLACGAGSEDLHPLVFSPFGPFEADLVIESPGEGSHLPDSTVVIDFTILTNGARIEAVEGSLDGGFWLIIEEDGQWTLTDLEEGLHTVKISILEVGGRIVERTVNFNVDLTDPEILDYSPVGDNVLVDSPIIVEFSEELMQYGTEFDFPIIGNVSIEENTATFYPTYPMEENTEYEVRVLARDLSGRTVEFDWTFTTTGASYRVFGRVVDQEGRSLDGVNVVISYLGNQSEIFNEITSGSGDFEARAEPGSYRITLTKEGYEDLEMEFEITDNLRDLGNIEMEEVEEDPDGMNICLIVGIASLIILVILLLIIFLFTRKKKKEETEE